MPLNIFIKKPTGPEKVTFSDLPIGMFRYEDVRGISHVGYKLEGSVIYFEINCMTYENLVYEDNRKICTPLPNVKITIEEL